MAWMYFYGDYGSKEAIVALTLFTPAMGLILKGIIGGLCIKKGVDAMGRMSSEVTDDEENGLSVTEDNVEPELPEGLPQAAK